MLTIVRPMTVLRWAAYVIVPAVLWFALHADKLQEYFRTRRQLDDYRAAVERLKSEQQRLQREQAAFKAGGFPMEKYIRERLRMIKPGEKVILIERPDPAPAAQDGDATGSLR